MGADVGTTIGSAAIARAGCSPNDAEAVSILVGVDRLSCDGIPSGPHVAIAIWHTRWTQLGVGTAESIAGDRGHRSAELQQNSGTTLAPLPFNAPG